MKCELSLFVFLLSSIALFSQSIQTNGVFVTKDDFVSHNVKSEQQTDSLNFIQINLKGELMLVRVGNVTCIHIDSLFGYYSNGSKFRAYASKNGIFSMNGYYKVEDAGAAIVYSKRGFYKTANTTFYYFSSSIDSPIVRLTLHNLKRAYLDEALRSELKNHRHHLTDWKGGHMVVNTILQQYDASVP